MTSMTGGAGDMVERAATATLEWLVPRALEEDVGSGDWTTLWTVPGESRARARVVARQELVVAGMEEATWVFGQVDPELRVEPRAEPGQRVDAGTVLVEVTGSSRSILTAERTALNFVGRLSGMATLTRLFADRVADTGARVVDTRKTTPGWRALEKRAVRMGGGANHRMGLYDMVLVKENHIAAAGGIRAALEAVAAANDRALSVEVEVTSLEELRDALAMEPERILLDNMDPAGLREAVGEVRSRGLSRPPELEASGNVELETIREVASTGVDLVSVGALTHSAPAADVALELTREE